VRPKHKQQRTVGTVTATHPVPPPPHLTALEREQWMYYAPLLEPNGRLTLEGRDTLAKYCTALAQVALIKAEMEAVGKDGQPTYRVVLLSVTVDAAGNEHVTAKTNPLNVALRQWLETARKYESDLILNPAAAIRVPGPIPVDDEHAGSTPHDFYGEGQRKPM